MGNTNGSILLFTDSIPHPPPRDGFAVGRASRQAAKKSSPPVLMMLAQIRALMDQQLGSIRLLLRAVEQRQCAIANRQADQAEALERLAARITAIERAITIRPAPETPRPTRRRPLS
jgi:hypothetical protein